MDAFKAFKLYTSVKLHFHRDSYDLFESGCKIRGTLDSFMQRNDTKIFHGWAAKWTGPDFIILVAANCLYGNPECAYDRETAEQNYKQYETRRQSITKIFSDDLDQLETLDEQDLIQKMMAKKITIETCVILHEILGLFNKDLPRVLEPTVRRIRKGKRFVRYNRERIERILKDRGYMKEVEA